MADLTFLNLRSSLYPWISLSSLCHGQVKVHKGLFLKDCLFYTAGVGGVLMLLFRGSCNLYQVR